MRRNYRNYFSMFRILENCLFVQEIVEIILICLEILEN
jgi:hypothetical protein